MELLRGKNAQTKEREAIAARRRAKHAVVQHLGKGRQEVAARGKSGHEVVNFAWVCMVVVHGAIVLDKCATSHSFCSARFWS